MLLRSSESYRLLLQTFFLILPLSTHSSKSHLLSVHRIPEKSRSDLDIFYLVVIGTNTGYDNYFDTLQNDGDRSQIAEDALRIMKLGDKMDEYLPRLMWYRWDRIHLQ